MNSPLDTFLSDQALATGRDFAAHGTPAVVVLPAQGACAWCDCDVLAKEHDPRFCAGCPHDAEMVLVVYSAATGAREWDILLCPGHKEDAMQFLTAVIAAGGFQ
ncbi:hypothetical protein [Streptomyces sp. C1-2]|uniref:hypothetical protein n=1 Tax=Streptomyces sp. C1-2 TaxID=2720022 RepID=UPI001432404D|nr:hypothetical protein [Streptomyces sp. C1-2]NJP73188.1 hypothetical protein [Streptomyces sp. C1-2]